MDTAFLVIALIFAVLAALIHVVIFFLESVLWSKPTIWRRFGVASRDDAAVLQPMAYNQGFYNLFLAIATGLGIVLIAAAPVHNVGVGIAGSRSRACCSRRSCSSRRTRSSPARRSRRASPLIALIFGVLWVVL
ncbi:hypothetical protein GCM10025881_19010 [Pseudolysinimonas kribbensis]|uniref:DUF1304 domain-containing protein n=1 Tax=Pseudolysinimonas kribbensis TaxID=433641 RepID=A0ABQ6K532_9MICO|nr:DUF1304 domain-containing protein [Pseudolysinimonas kribbensis]GMA95077.1 hypothetical protein GCM10025881_19010 [Pseudolysinimonas kribbensis]